MNEEKYCCRCAFRNDLVAKDNMTYCELWHSFFGVWDKCSSFAREDKENENNRR